jgi:hypothetical protein
MEDINKKLKNVNLNFFQGQSDYFKEYRIKTGEEEKAVKAKMGEFFNMKNVCFLFGSGTSCNAIPNMKGLFEAVSSLIDNLANETANPKAIRLKHLFDDINKKAQGNLEEILGILYNGHSYINGFPDKYKDIRALLSELINKIEETIFNMINIKFNTEEQIKVFESYRTFYQKLALRNKDLSRICVFTTNNDLYNERAMDSLNIHYVNGFSGGITKHFNPAMFNYTYSKQMDVSIDKYEPVENMVYLYKIHGSVNWIDAEDDGNNFFSIQELHDAEWDSDKNILIYPTPTKQNKSLGAPYVDLFREFQHRLLESNTVLFVIGYSFSDEHVNDIIYRALATNTTFNLVVINEIPSSKPIAEINDKRIYRLWGTKEYEDGSVVTLHHFDYIVENWLPDLNAFAKENKVLDDFVSQLKKITDKDK